MDISAHKQRLSQAQDSEAELRITSAFQSSQESMAPSPLGLYLQAHVFSSPSSSSCCINLNEVHGNSLFSSCLKSFIRCLFWAWHRGGSKVLIPKWLFFYLPFTLRSLRDRAVCYSWTTTVSWRPGIKELIFIHIIQTVSLPLYRCRNWDTDKRREKGPRSHSHFIIVPSIGLPSL